MNPELVLPIGLYILVSSYISAAGITYGPPAIREGLDALRPVIRRSIALRKVGGIWWLRVFKLRVSVCISHKP